MSDTDGTDIDVLRARIAELELDQLEADEQRTAILNMLEDLEESRKEVERAKSEWNAAFDAVTDPIFLHDGEYRVVRANLAYARLTGQEINSLIGRPYYELFPRSDGPMPSCLQALHDQGELSEELNLPNGQVWTSTSFPMMDASQQHIYSIHLLKDITAQRRVERKQLVLSQALRQSSAAIMVLNHEHKVEFINPAFETLFGYQLEELAGSSPAEMWHDAGAETLALCMVNVHTAQPWIGDVTLMAQDGSHRPVHISGAPISGESKLLAGYVISMVDMREMQAASQRLRTLREAIEDLSMELDLDQMGSKAAEASLRLTASDAVAIIIRNELDGVLSFRWQHGVEDTALLERAALEMTRDGCVCDEVLQTARPMVITDYPDHPRAVSSFIEAGVHGMLLVPLQYGSTVLGVMVAAFRQPREGDLASHAATLELLSAIGRQLGVALAREQLKDQLEQARAHERLAVETIPDLLYRSTMPDYATTYVSPAVQNLTGYTEQDIMENPGLWLEHIHADDLPAVKMEIETALAQQADGYTLSYRFCDRDDSWRWFEDRGQFERNADGIAVASFGIVTDITEKRTTAQALERANRALRVLSAANEAVVHAADSTRLLQAVCRIIVKAGGYRSAFVGVPEKNAAQHIQALAYDGCYENLLEVAPMSWGEGPQSDCPAGRALRTGGMDMVQDIANNPACALWREACETRGYGSSVAFPLLETGKVNAVLVIYASEANAFDDEETRLLQEMSTNLAYGLASLKVRKAQHRSSRALAASEKRLRSLIESEQDGVLVVDSKDRILFANPAAAGMMGLPSGGLVGNHPPFALPEEQGETELEDATGTSVPVELRVSSSEWEGRPARLVTLHDIGEHRRMELAQREHTQELEGTLVQTIQTVARAVEKRDPYTAGHQQRVAELAVAIARKMGLDEDHITGIRLGGIIHDIGKIYIPAEILNRPGRLSAVEFEMIKSHTVVGHDIVKDVSFPWPVKEMVIQHHERLDGSGYPQGLKNGEIALEARILAVADVVEAITSHRPYRPGLGVDVALDEINTNRDIWYDSDAVDACLSVFHEDHFSLQ